MMMVTSASMALGGCGAATKPAATPSDETGDGALSGPSPDDGKGVGATGKPSQSKGGATASALPTDCAKNDGEVCQPPDKFILALCSHEYPTVALSLFATGTPWTRGYILHETKAVNASGGGSTGDMVGVDEEVILLRKRGGNQPGGMQVSGADGSIDVVRWDGSCVTVHPSEVGSTAPSKVKNARIVWNNLEAETRDALKNDATVFEAFKVHKAQCKGISFGTVSTECVKADKALSEGIAKHVREAGKLPRPNKLPEL